MIPPFYNSLTQTYSFHNSGISTYIQCPRLFYTQYVLSTPSYRISPDDSTDLFVGAVFAKTLEQARLLYVIENISEPVILENSIRTLKDLYADHQPTVKAKSLDNIILALKAYFKRFPLSSPQYSFSLLHGSPSIEVNFSIPFTLSPIYSVNYTGRLDGIVRDTDSNYWILDDKLTTVNDSSWSSRFAYDSQMLGYLYALQQKKVPVRGILIRKTLVSNSQSPSITPFHFVIPNQRILDWYRTQTSLIHRICNDHQSYLNGERTLDQTFPQFRTYQCLGNSRKQICSNFSNCYPN